MLLFGVKCICLFAYIFVGSCLFPPKLTDYSCFGCLTTSVANRFHVAVRLFSKISQMTSKCGKYKKEVHFAIAKCSLMFLPLFDVFCDLLLKRRTAIWNLLVYIIKN